MIVSENELVDGDNAQQKNISKSKKYLMLLTLSLALFTNAEMWISLPSINSNLKEYFKVEANAIDWFSNVFLVVYAIQVIPFTFLPQLITLNNCIIGGVVCNTLGLLLRVISFSLSKKYVSFTFAFCMVGNVIGGAAQGFLLFLPPLLSKEYFSRKSSNLTTTIPIMCNIMGTSIGFLFAFTFLNAVSTIKWVGTDREMTTQEKLIVFSGVELFISVVTLMLSIIFCRNTTNKSQSKNTLESYNNEMRKFGTSLRSVFLNFKAILLIFSYGLYYSLSTAFYTYLNDFMTSFYKGEESIVGYMGSLAIIAGSAFMMLLGYSMKYKVVNKNTMYVSGAINVFCAVLLVALLMVALRGQLNIANSFVIVILYGMMAAPYLSFGLEILSDETHPSPPNIVASIAITISSIVGICLIYGFGEIADPVQKYTVFFGLSAALYLASAVIIILIKIFKKTE